LGDVHGFPWWVRFGLVPSAPTHDHNHEPYLLTRWHPMDHRRLARHARGRTRQM